MVRQAPAQPPVETMSHIHVVSEPFFNIIEYNSLFNDVPILYIFVAYLVDKKDGEYKNKID